MKIAAVLGWILGLGFGLPCIYGIWYFVRHDQVWTFLGFPTYGEGPFTKVGVQTTVPLLVAFLVVCVTEVVTAWMLWQQPTPGAWLALALLPVGLVFWIGFALPYAISLGASQAVVILIALAR